MAPITQTLAFSLLASAGTTSARAIEKRSISYTPTCDAARDPNWNDCQNAFNDIGSIANNDAGYVWEPPKSSGDNALTYTWGNCVVAIIFLDGQSFTQNYVVDAIDTLASDCRANGAGGRADLNPGNNLSMAVSVYAAQQNPVKRDNSWTTAYTIQNASPEQYRQQVRSATPGGSSWDITTSETRTNRVETSVSISADLFSLFQASASVTYGFEETTEKSENTHIDNTCATSQTGTLFWYPEFTQYHGGFSGGPSPEDIYIPVSDDFGAVGKYQLVCSG